MTEKQFTTHIDECGMYYYIFDGKKILAEAFYKDDAKEIVDKLNTLYEENEQLKKENQQLKDNASLFIRMTEKENEKLKKALKELKEIGDYQEDRIKELDKENMEYYHLINCGNCKYHNWDYDGEDEFEVCEKGNNERLMYNKFCKEWRRD